MKKIIASLVAAVAVALPAHSDPLKDNEYYSNHSMGCMLLQECTDDVEPIWGIDYLAQEYPLSNWNPVAEEFSRMLNALTLVDVQVYLADEKYFPVGHRGVYHTVSNNFYLNKTFMGRPHVLMSVMRHEGWHAAQDCMAGSLDNNNIAIIYPEEDVPQAYVLAAEIAYAAQPAVLPWEKEAKWAGGTPDMTLDVLRIINETNNRPWDVIEPTPMTREWLVNQGYINE